MSKRFVYTLLAVLVVMALVLSGCATPTATSAPKPTDAPTQVPPTKEPEPTPIPPTPEPTAIPLGSPENPIIMAQAPSATSQELVTGGQAIAAKLTEMTGYTITVVVPTNYSAMIEAMASGNAHMGWMPPLAYMLASEKGAAEVAMAVIRSGSDHYGSQYIANVASGFTSYFDPETNTNTADAATALAQFDGKKPCWTDQLSASGYVIPQGLLGTIVDVKKLKAAAFVQGHPTVVTALYSGGICDFGATFIDARTNKALEGYADLMDKVVVIYRTDPIIPNDNVAFATGVPDEVKANIVAALQELSDTEEGRALLKSGGFDIQGLKVVEDSFYDEFRVYLQASGLDVTTLG